MIFYSGYMSPKNARYGHFSVKTNVFSFRVLVLESEWEEEQGICNSGQHLNLLGHVSINNEIPLSQWY